MASVWFYVTQLVSDGLGLGPQVYTLKHMARFSKYN